ncbi:hypothetical protein BU25DRAFT_170426 [Macroventuria anomochaeta]|uniref:Uncharacterized protein n=1 Tax=Macroventuria anomochaeta TaxID=301207 RepID=A0ACB6RPN1_9PLEO|nr:uncharacterized protein BU25DRAFT_170426 [Macroventuria anomochaeta]KAF2623910.1 hypothetical protein BU25DRAFT_170426 [Macroventuria anomochaeta]
MNEIPAQRPARRLYVKDNQYTRPDPNQFAFKAAASRSGRKRRNNKARVKNVPTVLRAQAAELCSARTNLERAYNQEQNVQDLSSRCTGVTFNFPEVTAARARAERRYVNCLIRYLRDTNQMNPAEATQMQANFTRRKMEQARMSNRVYLLGMYLHELK